MHFIAVNHMPIGQHLTGQLAALSTWIYQLKSPLEAFSTFYGSMQMISVHAERTLALFREQRTVVDKPTAVPLEACKGEIEFRNAEFSYHAYGAETPTNCALADTSSRCKPGTITAPIGEAGAGKSTIFRLLFRFYTLQKGYILIDGCNVEDTTISPLCQHIGVVSQDIVLLNDTLMYNFGGQVQRVLLARIILANPRIMLLDEATAHLDADSEDHIQRYLAQSRQNRTTLVIAHRLSTTQDADQILVMSQGRVAESGTHVALLAKKGLYAAMWSKHRRSNPAEDTVSDVVDDASTACFEGQRTTCSDNGLKIEEFHQS
ncbi:hypothetical protein N7523_005715 [Penicillium sp. IBT 18751x]|nr:hypothetical protein N7523_005715 [Penicillium sp. IBT 18751x]